LRNLKDHFSAKLGEEGALPIELLPVVGERHARHLPEERLENVVSQILKRKKLSMWFRRF
jgi:hypothetical protein